MARTPNDAFKSSSPRLPHEGASHFLQKLDPWFVEFARLFKDDAKPRVVDPKRGGGRGQPSRGKCRRPVQQPPVAVLPEWPRTLGELLGLLAQDRDPRFVDGVRAMQQKIPRKDLATDLNQVLPSVISLLKYHTTVPELLWREMQGDKKAGRQVVETADLYNRWIHEQLPRGGVRFKSNVPHNVLMLYGLVGGIERLTSQELADFFDQLCPCRKTHTLEVVRRLREKLLKVLVRGGEAADSVRRRMLLSHATISKECGEREPAGES